MSSDQVNRGTITLPRQGRVREIELSPENTRERLERDYGFTLKDDSPASGEATFWTPVGQAWTRSANGSNRDRVSGPDQQSIDIDTAVNRIMFQPEHDPEDLL